LGHLCSCITLPSTLHLSHQEYFENKFKKKLIEIDEKRLRKKVTLIKTDSEEGRLQPTPAGHSQLATPLFISPHDILKKKN
jgi:hypothetical protein